MGELILGCLAIVFTGILCLAILSTIVFIIVFVLGACGLFSFWLALFLTGLFFWEMTTRILGNIQKRFLEWRRH